MTLKVEIDTKSKLWDKVEIITLKVEIDTKSKLWDKVEIMTLKVEVELYTFYNYSFYIII